MADVRHNLVPVLLLATVLLTTGSLTAGPVAAQEVLDREPALSWPPQGTLTPLLMHESPYLPVPAPVKLATPALLPLLTEALNSDDDDLQRDAALSIIMVHRDGYLDCSALAEPMIRALQAEKDNRLVRKDLAQALVVLAAPESADALFAEIGRDPDLVRIIEPALGRWKHQPAQDEWLRRLQKRETEPAYLVRSAIRGSGLAGSQAASAELQAIVLQSPHATWRMAAAEALGNIHDSGQEAFARQLLEERSAVLSPSSAGRTMLHRLIAAHVLRRHRSDEARATLLTLAADDNGAVAAVAWESLLNSAPGELRTLTRQAAAARDSKVRSFVVQTLLATRDADAVEQLGRLLADRHPYVRNAARQALQTISETPELKSAVLAAGSSALAGETWQELEQSAVLLGTLDHEPAVDRCFELLTHPRAEAAIASAWALRKLAVPETLPRLLQFCEDIDRALGNGKSIADSAPAVAAHLFETMGQMQFEAAEPLLRRYIAKSDPRLRAPMRRAAINALGWLKAGSHDEQLSTLFYERLVDESPLPIYELEEVRYASIIAIGLIKAPSMQARLQQHYPGQPADAMSYSLAWALTQYTGDPLSEAVPSVRGAPMLPIRPTGFRLETSNDRTESETDSADQQ